MIVAVALQLLGVLAVAVAAWFLHPAASLAVVGAAVFQVGLGLERDR